MEDELPPVEVGRSSSRRSSRDVSPVRNVIVAPRFNDAASSASQPQVVMVQSGNGVMQPMVIGDGTDSHYSYNFSNYQTDTSLHQAPNGIIQMQKREPTTNDTSVHEDSQNDADAGDEDKATEIDVEKDDDEEEQEEEEEGPQEPKPEDGRTRYMRFTDLRYRNPRISLIVILLTDIFNIIFMYGDLLVSLLVCQSLFQESWGGTVVIMGCIISGPFWISWGSVLAYLEQLMVENPSCSNCIRMLSFPYMFPPFGMLILFALEMIFMALKVLRHFANFFCNPTRFTEATFDPKFHNAYPRFRQITHAIAHSSVMFVYLIFILVQYGDDLSGDDKDLMYVGISLSFVNFVITFVKIFYKRKQLRLRMWEYIMMSLNLSSGYVPELNNIKDGTAKEVDWSRSHFGHYTYSVLIEALQSEECDLEEVLLSTFTLKKISPISCFQLGHTFKQNGCSVKFIKQAVRETWLDFDDDNTGCVEWDDFESKCKEFFAEHPEEAVEKAIECAKKNIVSEAMVYFSDFNNLIRKQEFLSMLVIGNPTLYAVETDPTCEDPSALRLLEFMDGLDQINKEDPKSGKTALYFALENQDEDLIKELQERNAASGDNEHQMLGEIVTEMMKEAKTSKEAGELSNMRAKVKEMEALFLMVNTYDCIEWDPPQWSDEEGNNLMHMCAIHGTIEVAKFLLTVPRLDSECLPAPNQNEKTPLMCANDRDIIELFKDNLSEYEHMNQAINTKFADGVASDVNRYYTQAQHVPGLPAQFFQPQLGMH